MMIFVIFSGPHREMAVDVPDSFIARNKTPPRYPPPRPPQVRGATPAKLTLPRTTAMQISSPIDDYKHLNNGRSANKTDATEIIITDTNDFGPTSGSGSSSSFSSKKSSHDSNTTRSIKSSTSSKDKSLLSEESAVKNGIHYPEDNMVKVYISDEKNPFSKILFAESVAFSARNDSVVIPIVQSVDDATDFNGKIRYGHREMAVDVPDGFVQIVKSTPKYPGLDKKPTVIVQVRRLYNITKLAW